MATYNFDTSSVNTREGQRGLLSKTFTYMFILLLVTVMVSLGVSFGVYKAGLTDRAHNTMLIAASATQIILTIVIMFTSLKQGKASLIPMILYSVCMGVLISSFSRFLNWWTMAATFGVAALSFGGMALIGYFSKNASGFGLIGFGLLIGLCLAGLFNLLIYLLVPGSFKVINVIVSGVVVLAVLCIAAYDVYNIKAIAQTGENSDNLALFLAFNLYVDFIVILVRLLQLVLLLVGNNRD